MMLPDMSLHRIFSHLASNGVFGADRDSPGAIGAFNRSVHVTPLILRRLSHDQPGIASNNRIRSGDRVPFLYSLR